MEFRRFLEWVKGIINLRGEVIPIIDLWDKFDLQAKAYGEMTRVIVVDVEGRSLGMVVDAASQVVNTPADQIDPPSIVEGLSAEYVRGVDKLDARLVILINISRILSAEGRVELARLEDRMSREAEQSANVTV